MTQEAEEDIETPLSLYYLVPRLKRTTGAEQAILIRRLLNIVTHGLRSSSIAELEDSVYGSNLEQTLLEAVDQSNKPLRMLSSVVINIVQAMCIQKPSPQNLDEVILRDDDKDGNVAMKLKLITEGAKREEEKIEQSRINRAQRIEKEAMTLANKEMEKERREMEKRRSDHNQKMKELEEQHKKEKEELNQQLAELEKKLIELKQSKPKKKEDGQTGASDKHEVTEQEALEEEAKLFQREKEKEEANKKRIEDNNRLKQLELKNKSQENELKRLTEECKKLQDECQKLHSKKEHYIQKIGGEQGLNSPAVQAILHELELKNERKKQKEKERQEKRDQSRDRQQLTGDKTPALIEQALQDQKKDKQGKGLTKTEFFPAPSHTCQIRVFGRQADTITPQPQLLEIRPKVSNGIHNISIRFSNADRARVFGVMSGAQRVTPMRPSLGHDIWSIGYDGKTGDVMHAGNVIARGRPFDKETVSAQVDLSSRPHSLRFFVGKEPINRDIYGVWDSVKFCAVIGGMRSSLEVY